jgi:hypothetical protein
MTTSTPTRIDADLFDAAKLMGEAMSRSAAQQINHWARIGRVFESTAGISHRDILRVVAGQASYDGLSDQEQILVRAIWDERLADGEPINLAAEFAAGGVTDWVEADDDGKVVVRSATNAPAKKASAKSTAARR